MKNSMPIDLKGKWVNKLDPNKILNVEFAHSGIVSGESLTKNEKFGDMRGRFYFSEAILLQQFDKEE